MTDWKLDLDQFLQEKETQANQQTERAAALAQQREEFMAHVVLPAFEEVKAEFLRHGRTVRVDGDSKEVYFELEYADATELLYQLTLQTDPRGFLVPEGRIIHPAGSRAWYAVENIKSSVSECCKQDVIDSLLSAYMRNNC